MEVSGRVFVQPPFAAMRCQQCGIVFKSAVLSVDELNDYYKLVDYRGIGKLFPTERQVLDMLERLPRTAAILDFGCSTGRLLSHLPAGYRRFGVEINDDAAATAACQGIEMIQARLLRDGSFQRQFDAIVMIDVFEHLHDPMSVLESLIATLKPHGWLIISTGNADSKALRNDLANSWYLQNVEHVIMMTKQHARYLAHRFGLKELAFMSSSHYDAHAIEKMSQIVKRFAYDEFASASLLSKTVLKWIPFVRRARNWTRRPAFKLGADHVTVWWELSRFDLDL